MQKETYKIVRFYREEGKPSVVLYQGLTSQEAKDHCNREWTHGEDWFDAFYKEYGS